MAEMSEPVGPDELDRLFARFVVGRTPERFALAVSGGSDSIALMVLLAEWLGVVGRPAQAFTVLTVDHRLRPQSAAEAATVARQAAALGYAHATLVWDGDKPQTGLQAAARTARYRLMAAYARAHGIGLIFTGHTADDQAETMLLNLMRGASSTGLAAMRPGPRRPILALRRATTVRFCHAVGIKAIDDPTNRDPAFLRNRVRHELLPLMNEMAARDLVPVLTRQAGLLRDDGDLLDHMAESIDPTDAKRLAAAPVQLARRAVRRWLTTDHPPDAATVERVLRVAGGQASGCDVGSGRRVERSRQRLQLLGEPTGTPSR